LSTAFLLNPSTLHSPTNPHPTAFTMTDVELSASPSTSLPTTDSDDIVRVRGPKLVLLSESFHRQLIQRDQSPIIHALMQLPNAPTPEAVLETLKDTIKRYPLFGAVVEARCNGMYWSLDPNASERDLIKQHVTYKTIELTEELDGEEICSSNHNVIDRCLRTYVSSVIGRPFNLEFGAFQLDVVTYTSSSNKPISRCDLLWRMHHGIGDGVLLSQVLIDICTPVEEGDDDTVASSSSSKSSNKPKPPKPSACTMFGKLMKSIAKVSLLPLNRHDPPTILKAPSSFKKIGTSKSYGSSSVWSVDRAKKVGKLYGDGVTLNDVVMAAISWGIRKYCVENDDPLFKRKGDNLNIRALAVVNTRMGNRNAQMLSDFQNCIAANEFSYVIPTLPLGDLTVPNRVKFCSDDMKSLKSSPEAFVIKKLNNGIRNVAGGRFTLAFNADFVINKMTMFFSNLPGPTKPLACCGVAIKRLSNFVHPMMYGCGVAIQSYNGDIIVNCSVDVSIVKDVDSLMRYVDEGFEVVCREVEVGENSI
jgi:hypothetical protein